MFKRIFIFFLIGCVLNFSYLHVQSHAFVGGAAVKLGGTIITASGLATLGYVILGAGVVYAGVRTTQSIANFLAQGRIKDSTIIELNHVGANGGSISDEAFADIKNALAQNFQYGAERFLPIAPAVQYHDFKTLFKPYNYEHIEHSEILEPTISLGDFIGVPLYFESVLIDGFSYPVTFRGDFQNLQNGFDYGVNLLGTSFVHGDYEFVIVPFDYMYVKRFKRYQVNILKDGDIYKESILSRPLSVNRATRGPESIYYNFPSPEFALVSSESNYFSLQIIYIDYAPHRENKYRITSMIMPIGINDYFPVNSIDNKAFRHSKMVDVSLDADVFTGTDSYVNPHTGENKIEIPGIPGSNGVLDGSFDMQAYQDYLDKVFESAKTGEIPNVDADVGTGSIDWSYQDTATLNFEPLRLNNSLTQTFPFSIPWDFVHAVQMLQAPRKVPIFDISFMYMDFPIEFTIDLSDFESIARIARWGNLVIFNLQLILISRKIIGEK